MIDSEIGRKIREARKKKGMTQAELGQKIGTTAAWIWMYENGRRPLDIETLVSISTALEVPFEELFPNLREMEEAMPDDRYGRNPSGMPDPTRTKAEENLARDEKRISDLVHVLRYVADGAGFEIVGRVVLIDKRTGRAYK